MNDELEYHRRRAEMELEVAVAAADQTAAIAHLELARMHRAKRHLLTQARLGYSRASGKLIFRPDKEA